MIQIEYYYQAETPQGVRTIKCMQFDDNGNPYGIYSPSNCVNEGDNQGMVIPENSLEASIEESEAWNIWYNS